MGAPAQSDQGCHMHGDMKLPKPASVLQELPRRYRGCLSIVPSLSSAYLLQLKGSKILEMALIWVFNQRIFRPVLSDEKTRETPPSRFERQTTRFP